MKITLSKRKRGERRHIVLVCTAEEAYEINHVIYNDVLDGEVFPVRERMMNGNYRYRFAMKYLEPLMLTFPFADCSPGLESRLSRQGRELLQEMEIPELDIEGFTGELYNFQKIGVGKILEAWESEDKNFLLTDEMGLGKTIQDLAAIVAAEAYPALVVVPNGIKFNWERMVHQFTDASVSVVDGTAAERWAAIDKDTDILVINCEGLRVKYRSEICKDEECPNAHRLHQHAWYTFAHPTLFFEESDITDWRGDWLQDPNLDWRVWSAASIDEYHRFKNPLAQQSIGLHFLKASKKLGMSGTPVLNGRPEEMWSMFHWMWPERFPDYNQFCEDIMIKKGSKVVAYRGKKLKELKQFFMSRSLRRRKDQVLDDLPEVVNIDRYIDLTGEQRRLYNQILEELLIWIEEEPRRIPTVLAQMTRLKQAAFSPELYGGSKHSAKLDELKEVMQELTANGEKAIVFSQWSKATRIMQRELAEYNPAYIDGSVNPRDRMKEVDKFNNDEDCKVFIGTIGACKEGFTLSAATYVIHMDEGWVPTEKMQATARSAAGGLRGVDTDVSHVHVITIRANHTIEEEIDQLLQRKQAMNNRLTEVDGGMRVERLTLEDLTSILRRA